MMARRRSLAAAAALLLPQYATGFSIHLRRSLISITSQVAEDLPTVASSMASWNNLFTKPRTTRNLKCGHLLRQDKELQERRPAPKARVYSLSTFMKRFRKAVTTLFLATLILVSTGHDAANAVSGGRLGGSFDSSTRSSGSSASYRRSSPSRSYYSPLYSPRRGYFSSSPTRLYSSVTYANEMSPAELVVVTGTGIAIVYGFVNKGRSDEDDTTILGSGVSVASLTVALDVPNRDSPDNILRRLTRLSDTVKTDTRRGVQNLISNVALELLRDEKSIISGASSYRHFPTSSDAQREFNRISVQERSKFDKETVNKFGGVDLGQVAKSVKDAQSTRATAAVVTLTLSIEGDQTKLPKIRSRKDLAAALSRIASDAPVGDCLLAGEVLWAPEVRSEHMNLEDVYAYYPDLFPL